MLNKGPCEKAAPLNLTVDNLRFGPSRSLRRFGHDRRGKDSCFLGNPFPLFECKGQIQGGLKRKVEMGGSAADILVWLGRQFVDLLSRPIGNHCIDFRLVGALGGGDDRISEAKFGRCGLPGQAGIPGGPDFGNDHLIKLGDDPVAIRENAFLLAAAT